MPVHVVHKTFGRGKVLRAIGDKVEVDFQDAGRKTVLRSFLTFVDAHRPPLLPAQILITRLDKWLRINRPRFYKSLRKGLSAECIESTEKAIGHALPHAFKEFYKWKNGQMSYASESLMDLWHIQSLQNAATERETMNEGDYSQFLHWWNPMWVPFATNYAGDSLCLDLCGCFNGVSGQIVKFIHDDDSRIILFPSFDAWLEVTVLLFEESAYEYKEDGRFECWNEDAKRRLMKKICKGYPKRRTAQFEG